MLTVEHISKNFGALQAVDNVSFEINQGDIVGFLGKNGAGKTTLMRMITAFLAPSSGRIFIDGDDITKHSLTIRKKIGYLPENPPLYTNMTVLQYVKFAAEIKGVTAKKQAVQLAKVLEDCQLEQVKHKTISTLSKGYKQRVGIAQAIIHEPKLLILDEPTSGLDPMQVQQVLALINNQKEQRTVLLSTHTLPEIEKIAQRILMIKSGQLIIDQSLKTLLKGTDQQANIDSDNLVKGNINTADENSAKDENSQAQALTLEQIFFNHHQESAPLSSKKTIQTPIQTPNQNVSNY
ncbi:ABC transporter ATP-binding protein [Colwellia sp. MB02u-18]|nr:ABC transporter ATP-binding protein [Colwellia sp. MB3u-45]MBA6266075.1 ABC transporter ATP-binding protein [Colwellia sp. MB3u-43]MBA6320515.1 ABC transporter ATP-binding protein [Colwellia sp. MB02u-19]MBA6323402.1 ABC transporter ATP-binding protein [Colwellia sp. MB02u-18]MBA6329900.1 ABC transporter ATP-binding protein [Colwellia sp. MB02u-12]MBA6343206.1 ABC transporter ATP-binding protein [Colwellia sp. MB02u-1]